MSIKDIKALEIFDSRGYPTVEVSLKTERGTFRAAVPSGASTGIYEAVELRDDDKSRLLGKGVLKAVENVNSIIKPALLGKSVLQQKELDELMVQVLDGTKNQYGWSKSKLGANAILAVSLAVARAGAAEVNKPLYAYVSELAGKHRPNYVLPVPAFNIINGGKHAGNSLAFQELMILPTGAKTFREAMTIGAEVYQHLKAILKSKYGLNATNVGDEGGFAPDIKSAEEGLELIMQALEKSGHKGKVEIGMDVAASELYTEDGKYDLDFKNPNNDGSKKISSADFINYYKDLVAKFPIISIEDPFDQDDWESYAELTRQLGDKVQIVGDDLLVTNPTRVKTAIEKKACNALLLKVNQIGSLTEAIEASNLAVSGGFGVMVSHRSGETEDTFIADLVVGLGTGQIKTGAPCRSERLAKYNQILRIEDELGSFFCKFAGDAFKSIASPYYNRLYKYCPDAKDADALGWAFINPKESLVQYPFKFHPIEPNSVIVDITHSGLCHTDYHIGNAEFGPAPYPFVAGHEIVGIVSYVGSDVKKVKVGDRVGYGPQRLCCEKCEQCKSGCEQLCKDTPFHLKMVYPTFFGGYATRVIQPDTNVYKIPESLPSDRVPPILCAGVTTFVPLKKHTKPGQRVAIIGIGGLGHLAIQYAAKLGCKVTAFSSTKDKEDLIKKLGAEEVVSSTDLKELAQHSCKYDVVMNTTSTGDGKLYEAWTSLTATRGVFIAVGAAPSGETPSLNLFHLQINEITIVGSIMGGRKETEETLEFSAKHDVLPLVETFEFEEFPQALELLAKGKPKFRVVVNCENYSKKHGWNTKPINP